MEEVMKIRLTENVSEFCYYRNEYLFTNDTLIKTIIGKSSVISSESWFLKNDSINIKKCTRNDGTSFDSFRYKYKLVNKNELWVWRTFGYRISDTDTWAWTWYKCKRINE
jgi:hypothetical protein